VRLHSTGEFSENAQQGKSACANDFERPYESGFRTLARRETYIEPPMANLMWSVGMVVDDVELRSLSSGSIGETMLQASGGSSLKFSLPPENDETGIETLRMEVAAESADDAEDRALNIVYAGMRAARLPDRVVPIAWVAPVGVLRGGESYLDQANDLLDAEQFGLAIVAAEIHLESQAKTMIELAIKRLAPSMEEVFLQHRNNTKISHFAGQNMINRFIGVDVRQLPEWESYRAHLSRRNEVAHSGMSFGEEEAADSIAIVRSIWLCLAEAARQAESGQCPTIGP
jgi:hypothetical protein